MFLCFLMTTGGHKQDVSSREDVQWVVREQYAALLMHAHTAPKFAHLNLVEHLPKIDDFWCFVLGIHAEKHPYRGSSFEPHVKLHLDNEDFQIWTDCLFKAIDSRFAGPIASDWKNRAEQMGLLFRHKLGLPLD
jgi:hemoglobin